MPCTYNLARAIYSVSIANGNPYLLFSQPQWLGSKQKADQKIDTTANPGDPYTQLTQQPNRSGV
jgi:hypothetical protein